MKSKSFFLLFFTLFIVLSSFVITRCYAITEQEFNTLDDNDKRSVIEGVIKSYLISTDNISSVYNTCWFRCILNEDKTISKKIPFMKSQFEFRKIGQSYWFHHLWFPEHNGQFLEEADSDSFETYNANDGILRTLTSASHLSADEKYGYIMNKAAPACEKSVFPEIFNLSCRCDSWTSMKHIIENSSSWKFVISNKPNLIAIEMDDYHCEFPKTKSSGKRTIWLDPEKGFVLVYENRDMTVLGNQWWSRKIVEDFLLVDGIWIPSKVINYRHFPNSFLEGSGVELTLDDVSIGKVEQSHLSVEFPNGITVFDQIRGIEYIEGDYVPDTPTQDASIFRYSMIFLGCVLLIFGLWRMYYEMKNSSK